MIHGLSREVLQVKWYAIHDAESGFWHVRTSSLTGAPFGRLLAQIEWKEIAEHIVELHNTELERRIT
jgi:hypothetical protein